METKSPPYCSSDKPTYWQFQIVDDFPCYMPVQDDKDAQGVNLYKKMSGPPGLSYGEGVAGDYRLIPVFSNLKQCRQLDGCNVYGNTVQVVLREAEGGPQSPRSIFSRIVEIRLTNVPTLEAGDRVPVEIKDVGELTMEALRAKPEADEIAKCTVDQRLEFEQKEKGFLNSLLVKMSSPRGSSDKLKAQSSGSMHLDISTEESTSPRKICSVLSDPLLTQLPHDQEDSSIPDALYESYGSNPEGASRSTLEEEISYAFKLELADLESSDQTAHTGQRITNQGIGYANLNSDKTASAKSGALEVPSPLASTSIQITSRSSPQLLSSCPASSASSNHKTSWERFKGMVSPRLKSRKASTPATPRKKATSPRAQKKDGMGPRNNTFTSLKNWCTGPSE